MKNRNYQLKTRKKRIESQNMVVLRRVFVFCLVLSCIQISDGARFKILTSPCNVIENFDIGQKIKLIGDKQWENICPKDRFVTAVWSVNPYEPFYKAKCCGSGLDSALSWEIRDLSFFHKGETNPVKRWNIECDKYSVITGFRFLVNSFNVRVLSSIRCSILVNKIVDKDDCIALSFKKQSDETQTLYNQTWQHECPQDYGMVAVYDRLSFKKIEKAKCCRIKDNLLAVNWTTDFTKNLGGFEQSIDDDLQFKLYDNRFMRISYNATSFTRIKYGKLVSPGIGRHPVCLELNLIQQGIFNSFKVYVKDASTLHLLRYIKNFKPATEEKFQLFINPSTTAQLIMEAHLYQGSIIIRKMKVVNESLCKVDRCIPRPKYGCSVDEDCIPFNGNLRCVCKFGGTKKDGKCQKGFHSTNKPTLLSTSGKGKGPIDRDGTTLGPSKRFSSFFSTSKAPVSTNEYIVKRQIKSTKVVPGYMYSIAGGGIVIVLVVVGLIIYLCYQKKKLIQKRNCLPNKFEMNGIPQVPRGHTNLHQQYSLESIGTSVGSSNPLYVPYMNDLGIIEQPDTRGHSFVGSSTGSSFISSCVMNGKFYMDSTTGEPFYTRIDRSRSSIGQTPIIEESVTASVNVHYSEINKKVRPEDEHPVFDNENRRPSCMTLLGPDYGDSDSEVEDNEVIAFYIPPDDEEDILDGLNELAPESVQISSKILGQGAFGLVKLGTFVSVNGTHEVAVKSLKLQNKKELSQEERIRFFQEAALMSQFDHANVLALFGVLVGKRPCMVLEYLERGNLWKYLNRIRRVRKKENKTEILYELHCIFLKMARDIAAGMSYLAGLKFVHRDLAARNILLSRDLKCKIADFGLSRHFLKDEHYYKCHNGGQIPVKWTAPEALEFKRYSTLSDVWSYGIVLWEIWSIGERPYEGWSHEKVIKEVTEKAYRLVAPMGVPRLIYKLMIDCWHPDKNQRPTFSKIMFCLDHRDERILGKSKSTPNRSRSITFSSTEDDLQSLDTTFADLQTIYCKTE